MAPATRKICDYPGCTSGEVDGDACPQPYATPSNLQTRDEVAQDLKEHTFRAHELPLRAMEAGVKKIEAETKKIQAETARVSRTGRHLRWCRRRSLSLLDTRMSPGSRIGGTRSPVL